LPDNPEIPWSQKNNDIQVPLNLNPVQVPGVYAGFSSQIYIAFGHHFYSMFEIKIIIAHFHFFKQTYGFGDEKIFKSGEMN
jgi:hypothetical protein